MKKTNEHPVLIVGAGPVGLAAALSLASQGVPVRVIEAQPALTVDHRAGSFHPPTLEMLEPFGVTEAMHRIGIKVPRWQIRDRREGVIVDWDLGLISDLTPYPYRFHLEQFRLTPILLEKLSAFPHASVQFSNAFVSATQDQDSVTVTTDRETIKAPWLVGCDGGRSAVRRHIGTEFDGFTWPERFIVVGTHADFAAEGFTSNAYVADPREWAAVFHMPGLWRLAFPVHPEEHEQDVLAEEAVEARMQRFVERAQRYPVPHKAIYRVHQRVAREWRAGRILLAGDAAHLNNPLGAFGLNGGLHDAILLGEYLGRVWRGDADESLLDLYVRQRRAANVEFVQTQSIGNKRLLEEADPAARRRNFDELRRIAADRAKTRDYLIRSSMIWSVRRAAEVN
jgi:3-(3-hydroxy-phenyl)propionate hydroxylase